MLFIAVLIALMAAWLALGQSNATATTDVTVNYRATVTSVNDPSGVLGGVEIDDTITGTYSYDADARDLISSPARAVYRFDPASYGWTFDAPSGEIRSDSGLKRNYRIVIRNQSSDVYDALFSINRSPPGSGLRLNTANIKLRDNTGTAFSSDTLSATPPDPANFSSVRLFLNGCVVDGTICAQNQNGVSTFFSVVAKVTALSAGGDTTPPTVTAPTPILVECATIGGTPASNQAIQDWLSSASAVDDVDGSIPVTNDVTVGSCAVGEDLAALEAEAQAAAEQAEAEGGNHPGVPDDKAQRNFTDTESRIIPAPGGKDFLQAYNCQAVVDSAHQVIVAARATNQTSDKQQAAAMMEETIDNVGAVPREVSADAGYYSAKAVDELYALGVDPFVAPEQTRHGRVVPPAPRGRIPSHLSPRDRMRRKLQTKRGRRRYALRMQTVEPVFGQIKQARGFRQFLLRGLEKVNGEWSLICTGHNLLKLFRFGVNLHRKARADGPAQRIRNFAEVVSTALFAKLSGGRLGQPAKLVVAIHWR